MRILAISRRYPTVRQPAQPPDNRAQLDALADRHDLKLIRPVPSRASLAALRVGRARRSETASILCPTYIEPPGVWSARHVTQFADSVRAAVTALTKHFEPEVVLASWSHPEGWTALRVARELGVPVVLKTYGGADQTVRVQERILGRMLDDLRGADIVVAESRAAARAVIETGIPRRRVQIVPDGARIPAPAGSQIEARRRLGLPAADRLIVCFGDGLSASQATDLVKACAILRAEEVPYRCQFVGLSEGTRALQHLVRSRGLDDRVFFSRGPRDEDQQLEWLTACDVVVYPGYTDRATPILRQGIAAGRPFVATRVGAVPELAPPPFGRLVLAGAAGEMATALRETLDEGPGVTEAEVSRLAMTWRESADLLAAHMQVVVAKEAALRARRARRDDAARRTLAGRDTSDRRLDTGADVETLRKIASRSRS